MLLDSTYATDRTKGTMILDNLCSVIDTSFLEKTGLGDALWKAVFPNLLYLPPVTDVNESVELLEVTYPTLIKLSRIWHPQLSARQTLLDSLVRDGVIYGMMYAGDTLRVTKVELESLRQLIQEMGIYFVKHLKVRTRISK
jgi:Tti2 family